MAWSMAEMGWTRDRESRPSRNNRNLTHGLASAALAQLKRTGSGEFGVDWVALHNELALVLLGLLLVVVLGAGELEVRWWPSPRSSAPSSSSSSRGGLGGGENCITSKENPKSLSHIDGMAGVVVVVATVAVAVAVGLVGVAGVSLVVAVVEVEVDVEVVEVKGALDTSAG